MFDPSSLWLAPGYKKFLPQDFCRKHSAFQSASLDDFEYRPRSPNGQVSQQRRNVHSSISSGRYRKQPKPPSAQINNFHRPKSASQIGHDSDNPRYITKNQDAEGSGDNTRYRLPRRAKSASHMRHRPSGLQNKSVTEVERLHHARLMVSSIPVGRTTDHKPCAYCPVECRPKSSSSHRPISSTGLSAADVPSHFDRSKFWEKGTTRPRTAPTSRREFLHLPRHNFIRRGTVPRYTHFIKSLNLFPRDGSPLRQPSPPTVQVQDDGDGRVSSQFGGSSMLGDDDTLGCSPSDLDDSDWEDVADAEGDAEDAAEPDASDDVNAADCKEDAESVTASKDGKEEEGDELKTKLQDEAEPVMPSPAVVMQGPSEEDVDKELQILIENEDEDDKDGEEMTLPPAPSPSPVTVQPEDAIEVTDVVVIENKESDATESLKKEEQDKKDIEESHESVTISEPSESIKIEETAMTAGGEEEVLEANKQVVTETLPKKDEKNNSEKNTSGKSKAGGVREKLSEEVDGLKPCVTMIPTPPVKQQISPTMHQAKGKKEQTGKMKKQKKQVRIQEPDGTKPFKPGDAQNAEPTLKEVEDNSVIKILPKQEDTLPSPSSVPSNPETKRLDSSQEQSVERSPATNPSDLTSTARGLEKASQGPVETAQVIPQIKLGPPPPKTKVDLLGMDAEEILDMEMRLRRKGPGSYLSDTEDSLSDINDTQTLPANTTTRKFVPAPWNSCRVALSRRAGRFEMPMDMRELVGMTPVDYLLKYCKVNPQRKALYKRTFSKIDKDCDGKISRKELNQAVSEALVDTVNDDQVASVLGSIGVGDDFSSVKFSFFAPFCALLERLHYSLFVTEDSSDRDARFKDRIEDADFSALDWKLDGYEIDEDLRKLLYSL